MEGRSVYAKIFFGTRAARDEERDAAGAAALINAGIPTPQLLFKGRIPIPQARVLLYAAITDSANAEQLLERAESPQMRCELAERLSACVALHHRHGLMQCDMYLKNFLVSGGTLYTLDGDGIRKLPRLYKDWAAIDNLAVMLSKFDADDDVWIEKAYAAYCAAMGKVEVQSELRMLTRRIARNRRLAVKRYADRKIFRNCTDVVVEQKFRYFFAIARQAAHPELLSRMKQAQTWFEHSSVRFLKQGHTCTVASEHLDGRDVVIKRYNIKGVLHAIERAWRPSRAAHSWAAAHRLRMYGIATPVPLALLEWRWGPLRGGAYFVAEEVRAPDALTFFSDPMVSEADKALAAERIGGLLAKLQRLGLVHGDLKANNVLILPGSRPMLIDLDALNEPSWAWLAKRGHVRDLRRWMRNWEGNPILEPLMREALIRNYRNESMLFQAGIVSRIQSEMK